VESSQRKSFQQREANVVRNHPTAIADERGRIGDGVEIGV
jgi:hypothetical protein